MAKNQDSRKSPSERPALQPDRIYTRPEAAKVTGISYSTIVRAEQEGGLKSFRPGRRVLHSGRHLLDYLEGKRD